MKKKINYTGLHIIGEVKTLSRNELVAEQNFEKFIDDTIKKYKIHKLESFYHSFGLGSGFTGFVCLTESHISVHTWPEINYLTVDVFLCNYLRNNESTCRKIFKDICNYFDANFITKREIFR